MMCDMETGARVVRREDATAGTQGRMPEGQQE